MSDRKPGIYKVSVKDPNYTDDDVPTWWVRWWDVKDLRWQNCSHWTWHSAYLCVKRGWVLYGEAWKR